MNKLLVICGPTSTGKTDLGVYLAKQFDGEIISADSRQVYKGMDIGTGKDIPENSKFKIQNSKLNIKNKSLSVGFRKKDGVPIWLVDIVKPDYRFNVGEYAKLGYLAIKDIQSRNKLPIVVGGTGLYIRSLVEPLVQTTIPPNRTLRNKLEIMSAHDLQRELAELDKEKLEHMNGSDRENPRRLVRAIEIASWLQHSRQAATTSPNYETFLIGLTASLEVLLSRIDHRVEARFRSGIQNEVERLLEKGYLADLPSMTATGYQEVVDLVQNKKTQKEVINIWQTREHQYAKRQLTWFKKYPQILWFDISKKDYQDSIFRAIGKWYNST